MFRQFALVVALVVGSAAVADERVPSAAVGPGSLWFKPQLVESNSPVCDRVLEDARRYFVSEKSLERHYSPRPALQGPSIAGMRQVWPYPDPFALADKGLYLHTYTHRGCGGACEQYQLVASRTREMWDVESQLDSSPPPAPWYGLFQNSDTSYWLFLPDDSRDLLAYQLHDDGTWTRSCKVTLSPQLEASGDSQIKTASQSLEKLRSAVSGLTRGAGDCGSMQTHFRWERLFAETLPVALYRPWSLREDSTSPLHDEYGTYDRDEEGLADWAVSGTSEYESFRAYRAQLIETKNALASFYQAKFHWSKALSEAMARTAATGAVSVTIRFYMYEPFKSEGERALRKAILENRPLDAIIALGGDLAAMNEDGRESILSVAVMRPDVLRYLLSRGLSPNHDNAFGKTPLMYAVQANRLEAVKALLAAGANPNARTVRPNDNCYYTLQTFGMTPLHYGVRYASPEVIHLLLDHGALTYLKAEHDSGHNETPLEWFDRYTAADAVETNPNMPPAQVAEVRGRVAQRPKDLAAVVDGYVLKAEELYLKKNMGAAYEALGVALALDPKHERALGDMALIALKYDKLGQSLEAAEQLIKTGSSDKVKASAWFNQGLACAQANTSGMGGYVFYNGDHYCRYGVVYPFYRALKAEYSLGRRNKLLEVLESGMDSYCEDPTRDVAITLHYGYVPGDKNYRSAQSLYVLQQKGKEVAAEELAWTNKYSSGPDNRPVEKRIVPKKVDTVDLGERTLTVFSSDDPIQLPAQVLGHTCTGEKASNRN